MAMIGSDEGQVAQALEAIPCSEISREDWIKVGMALKEGGHPCSLWEQWSRDDSRFKEGECERLWNGFNGGSSAPVTMGTVFKMAFEYGCEFKKHIGEDKVLDWDDEFDAPETSSKMKPWEQAAAYIDALFTSPEDVVGYRLTCHENDKGKFIPSDNGSYGQLAVTILNNLDRYKDLSEAFGDTSVTGENAYRHPSDAGGAWIHINPLDGKGTGNANVTAFRHILIESDTGSLAEQRSIIESLKLPVVALVSSGGKSIHAVVRINASSLFEYHKRRERVWKVCRDAGLDIDEQNKNPSRLSRLPGFTRNGVMQELLFVDKFPMSWDEWTNGGTGSELPRSVPMSDVYNNMPDRKPWLITDVLRQGHKMILTGDSKAGKSFSLMELGVAIAEGDYWLSTKKDGEWAITDDGCKDGYKVANPGNILYVNLEIDGPSAFHRVKDIYSALGITPRHLDRFNLWNLRGKGKTISYLADAIVYEALRINAVAIFIDPIYKIEEGDENSAGDMAQLCGKFDEIVDRTGASLIYAHHHAKGAQGGKKAIDRGSGSGVFSRDPDAIIDLSPIHLSDDFKEEVIDDQGRITKTAWRVEMSLRESLNHKPFSIWFQYPIHYRDSRLDELGIDGDLDSAQTAGRATQSKNAAETRCMRAVLIRSAFMLVKNDDGVASIVDVLKEFNKSRPGVENVEKKTFIGWKKQDWFPLEGTDTNNFVRLKN